MFVPLLVILVYFLKFYSIPLFFILYKLTQRLDLYKIPGGFIYGFVGEFGTGKSLAMLEQGLRLANFYQRRLVVSFPVDLVALKKYCRLTGLKWFSNNGRVIVVDIHNNFTGQSDQVLELVSYDDSVILFDEAGIHFFSRGFKDSTRVKVFNRLFRIRHYGSFLLYTAQNREQIDIQLFRVTNNIIACRGFQRFSNKLKRSQLFSRSAFCFEKEKFLQWDQSSESRTKFINSVRLAGGRYYLRVLQLENFLNSAFSIIKYIFINLKKASKYSFKKTNNLLIRWAWFLAWYSDNLKFFLKNDFRASDELLLFDCFPSFQFKKYSNLDYLEIDFDDNNNIIPVNFNKNKNNNDDFFNFN